MTKNPIHDAQELTDAVQKSLDEYVSLGTKVQDEMFKVAREQMEACRQTSSFALKNQKDLFEAFEKTARTTRQLWLDGFKKWEQSLPKLPGQHE